MPRPESFHCVADGRGTRSVFVNANEIANVLWCDTVAGVVVFAPDPIRTKSPNRDEVYTRRLRGVVTVAQK